MQNEDSMISPFWIFPYNSKHPKTRLRNVHEISWTSYFVHVPKLRFLPLDKKSPQICEKFQQRWLTPSALLDSSLSLFAMESKTKAISPPIDDAV